MDPMHQIKVAVADDHPHLREVLCQYLSQAPDLVCVGQAGDGLQAVEMVQRIDVDVMVLDLSMPNMTGMEALHQIRALAPQVQIVVLSVYPQSVYAQAALQAGAAVYLEKDGRLDAILGAVRAAAASTSRK
jgi:two-component system, NarL family, invasion response regulator UvrY